MHPGSTTTGGDDDQGEVLFGCPFDQTRQPFADDAAHAAHDESAVGDGEGDAAGADHPGPRQDGVGETGPFLLANEPFRIGPAVFEFERVGGPQLLVHRLKGAFVEDLSDSFPRADVEMVVALRTDVELLLDFFSIQRRAASVAFQPQTFRNPFAASVFRSGGGIC